MTKISQIKFVNLLDLPSPFFMIVLSSVAACLLTNTVGGLFNIGVLFASYILIVAVFSQWLGMLALFPLVFSLPPTPSSIGLREAIFAALVLIVGLGAIVREFKGGNLDEMFKKHFKVISVCLAVLALNGVVALSRDVGFSDWLRGLIPFLFVLLFLPISILLNRNSGEQAWFMYSLLAFVLLMVGNVVFYYFEYSLWQPYWHILIDGQVIRTTDISIVQKYPEAAVGPLIDRITLQVQSATDAVLPVGMVVGFMLAVLFGKSRLAFLGNLLAMLSLAAILITFTRSMLASAVFVLLIFSSFVLIVKKEKIKSLVLNWVLLLCFGISFVFSTGMERLWIGRVDWLLESVRLLPDLEKKLLSDEQAERQASQKNSYSNNNENGITESESIKSSNEKLTPQKNERSAKYEEHFQEIDSITPSNRDVPGKKLDFNVGSRVEEYLVAWNIFKSNPWFGGGLGVKHDMRWETSEGQSLYQSVGYVHNWFFYALMVGGVVGLMTYGFVLLGPLFIKLNNLLTDDAMLVIRGILLTMAIYGLFFAVFRLITFNMILAAVWGYVSFRKSNLELSR